jgi:UDP-glucose-4-epimerase GalE
MRLNVLVAGGAGYIGSHTCKLLAAAGHNPVVLDDLSTGHSWAVKWGPLVVGDIGDRTLVLATLKRFKIHALIHFAAYAYVGESLKRPREYFDNNVTKTLTLLDALLAAGVDKVVFSSSCATYGVPRLLPITEDHPQVPISPYGASKLFVENILRWYELAYGLRYANLRYFNAAGADPDGELGEDHTPETHIIPLVIAAAQGKRSAIEIFGTDYDTKDGTAVRDYIHVCDLANAHIKALDYLFTCDKNISVNLGTGRGYSIYDIISAVEVVGGRRVSIIESSRRIGDPAALIANSQLGKSLLGWEPVHSDLATIVRTAWKWHEKPGKRGREDVHKKSDFVGIRLAPVANGGASSLEPNETGKLVPDTRFNGTSAAEPEHHNYTPEPSAALPK